MNIVQWVIFNLMRTLYLAKRSRTPAPALTRKQSLYADLFIAVFVIVVLFVCWWLTRHQAGWVRI